MNRQTKALRKAGLCSKASHAPTKSARERLPEIGPVQHGPNAFLPPDVVRARREKKKISG